MKTKTKVEHTPIILKLGTDNGHKPGTVFDNDGLLFEIEQSKAAFIVRAVNSHEKLLEASKQSLGWMSHPQDFGPEDLLSIIHQLEQAIKSAEVEN